MKKFFNKYKRTTIFTTLALIGFLLDVGDSIPASIFLGAAITAMHYEDK